MSNPTVPHQERNSLHEARSAEELLEVVARTMVRAGADSRFSVVFVTPAGDRADVYGSTWPGLPTGHALDADDLPGKDVLRHGRPIWHGEALPEIPCGTDRIPVAAVLPLSCRGERFGLFVLHGTVPPPSRPEAERIAAELGIALVNLQVLEEALRDRALDAAKLTAISATSAILSQLDLESVLVKTTEQSIAAVSAEAGLLYLANAEQQFVPRVEWGLPAAVADQLLLAEGGRVVDAVAASREVCLTGAPSTDPRFDRERADPLVHSLLVVPVASRDRTLGVLVLANAEAGAFSAQDREVALAIAGLAAIAMENAHLHSETLERERLQEQLRVAGAIQARLLPNKAPEVAGVSISGASRSCEESGGDYFDWFELAGGRLGFCVGDVSGHGIGAALLMTTARAFLRAHLDLLPDASRLLARLNGLLVRDMGGDKFVTLMYGVYDPVRGALAYASAGHEPALLYRHAVDRLEALDSTGFPLGLVDDSEFGTVEVTGIAPGDVLLITTDGIAETMNAASETFGHERLEAVVRAHREGSTDDMLKAILDATDAFRAGAVQRDDVTLVCLRFGPPR